MIEILNSIDSETKCGVLIFKEERHQSVIGKSKVGFQRDIIVHQLERIFKIDDLVLEHFESGAPYFKKLEGFTVSFSHSPPFYGIQIGKGKLGIDVQKIKVDIDKGLRFFVTDDEKSLINNHIDTNIIWSAKEALYKWELGDVVDYKRSILVNSMNEFDLLGQVNGTEVKCTVYLAPEFVAVYTK